MDSTVSVRDLRNRGGEVLARVQAGETLTVTSNGSPVAELRPLANLPLTTRQLIERRRRMPPLDADRLRADIDDLVDQTL